MTYENNKVEFDGDVEQKDSRIGQILICFI